jgi:hypothetical protein
MSKNIALYPRLVDFNTSGGMNVFVPQREYDSIRLLLIGSRK